MFTRETIPTHVNERRFRTRHCKEEFQYNAHNQCRHGWQYQSDSVSFRLQEKQTNACDKKTSPQDRRVEGINGHRDGVEQSCHTPIPEQCIMLPSSLLFAVYIRDTHARNPAHEVRGISYIVSCFNKTVATLFLHSPLLLPPHLHQRSKSWCHVITLPRPSLGPRQNGENANKCTRTYICACAV